MQDRWATVSSLRGLHAADAKAGLDGEAHAHYVSRCYSWCMKTDIRAHGSSYESHPQHDRAACSMACNACRMVAQWMTAHEHVSTIQTCVTAQLHVRALHQGWCLGT